MYPKARQMIKHLVADGRYDYLETGSLITLKQNVEGIVLPSEEEHINMYPLDFEEFLWALGDEMTGPYMKICFEQRQPMGEALHRKAMNLFRQYMLVGGMPQAVLAFVKTKDFEKADQVKRRILTLYRNNDPKILAQVSENLPKAMRVKFCPFLMVFRLSFPSMKETILWRLFRKRRVSESMRMPLCGWRKQ